MRTNQGDLPAKRRRVLIIGAAGRDFHNFNVAFRDDPSVEVVGFTAAQIPGIANQRYPPELAGPRYPAGIPIYPEDAIERLIRDERVDTAIFAYSDVSHEDVMHLGSRVLAAGADFTLLGPHRTMLESSRPVVAVGATRTGAGKSPTTRYVAALLERDGVRAVVVRHPMPYGDLAAQRVQRFANHADLERHHTTIEEREEYEPHLDAGRIVYAGVDYAAILAAAQAEAEVVLWDGGNNDFPFLRPDLFIVVADPLRAGDELRFHPGETNLRLADLIIVSKVDVAEPAAVAEVKRNAAALNPAAQLVEARLTLTLLGGEIAGRRVAVVEDGPTLTHGGMRYGAGVVAARRYGAAQLVDPAPYAVGSLRGVLADHPGLEPLVPAMGYGESQMRELEETLNAMPADIVLAATPIDLRRILDLDKPVVRVRYELEEVGRPILPQVLQPIVRSVLTGRRADG